MDKLAPFLNFITTAGRENNNTNRGSASPEVGPNNFFTKQSMPSAFFKLDQELNKRNTKFTKISNTLRPMQRSQESSKLEKDVDTLGPDSEIRRARQAW